MDALDLRILRELAWKPGDAMHAARGIQRPWDIARRLGVHGNTVKARLDALRATGVLGGVVCSPRPSLVGIRMAVYHFLFDDPESKRNAVPILEESGFVNLLIDFVGAEVSVALACPANDVGDAHARLLARACGATSFEHVYDRGSAGPPSSPLKRVDLRILRGLLEDGTRPLSEVAEEAGVTLKTARSRFNALADAGSFAMIPVMHPARAAGHVTYLFLVTYAEDADMAARTRLLASLPDVLLSTFPSYARGQILLTGETLAAVEDAFILASRDPAVADVRLLFVRDMWSDETPYGRAMDAMLEQLTPIQIPES